MALDANSTVWNFISWGRPFRLVSPLLDCSSLETTPIQIECGWEFSTVLTKSGDVYAWWPFGGTFQDQYQEAIAKLDKDESTKAIVHHEEMVVMCYTWEIKKDPVKLPILPNLPDLPGMELQEEGHRKETKLIKIAALNHCLIGLTNKGHVLKIDGLTNERSIQAWHYVSESAQMMWSPFLNCNSQLPNYSEIDKIKEYSPFDTTTANYGQEISPQVGFPLDTTLISHVSYINLMNSEFHV